MKNILFVLLFVLMANNNVFAQSDNNNLIIDVKRVFPYGLPKSIKGKVVDDKGKDSLFLEMKFKSLHEDENYSPEEWASSSCYDLVKSIINGKDTADFYYGIECTPYDTYGLFGGDDKPIIKYKTSKETDIESGIEYGIDTRLLLNKEGFSEWALDMETVRGYGGYIFNYDENRHITSITSPHGDHYKNMDLLLDIAYPNMPVPGPDGSELLFRETYQFNPAGFQGMDFSHSYYYDPQNPIHNSSGIMVNMLDKGFERDLYYAGLLGLPCKYLPNVRHSEKSYDSECFQGDYLDFVCTSIRISTDYTYTWAFSDFTKKTKSGESETVSLPTKVVIENKSEISDRYDGKKLTLTRTEKKKILDELVGPQKVIYTFEW